MIDSINSSLDAATSQMGTAGVLQSGRRIETSQSGLNSEGLGKAAEPSEFRKAFDQFVGQAMYGTMLKELRKSEQGVAYMDGGRAEEIFRGQLDQLLVERLSDASADTLTGPMYELMQLEHGLDSGSQVEPLPRV